MTFAALVRSRLTSLGYEQKDLARAAQVTDSYVSQLLTRRKAPPARDRTDIYPRMEAFLGLEPGELERLAETERTEEIKRRLGQTPEPMFEEFRDLVLRKCAREKLADVRTIFEARPFGTLEQLVTRSLLEVIQGVARAELDGESWIRLAARVGERNHEELRVIVLEFLDTDVFHVSNENCVAFIDPLLESWDVDLSSLRVEILLNGQLIANPRRVFTFVESAEPGVAGGEPGLADFLSDSRLSGDVTDAEVELLRRQRPGPGRPTKLYYYRALQNLRDPLHFEGKPPSTDPI